jgi:hypothetical protein
LLIFPYRSTCSSRFEATCDSIRPTFERNSPHLLDDAIGREFIGDLDRFGVDPFFDLLLRLVLGGDKTCIVRAKDNASVTARATHVNGARQVIPRRGSTLRSATKKKPGLVRVRAFVYFRRSSNAWKRPSDLGQVNSRETYPRSRDRGYDNAFDGVIDETVLTFHIRSL